MAIQIKSDIENIMGSLIYTSKDRIRIIDEGFFDISAEFYYTTYDRRYSQFKDLKAIGILLKIHEHFNYLYPGTDTKVLNKIKEYLLAENCDLSVTQFQVGDEMRGLLC